MSSKFRWMMWIWRLFHFIYSRIVNHVVCGNELFSKFEKKKMQKNVIIIAIQLFQSLVSKRSFHFVSIFYCNVKVITNF
jgi:hypothetical protein